MSQNTVLAITYMLLVTLSIIGVGSAGMAYYKAENLERQHQLILNAMVHCGP